ncbi:MAG: transporter [Cyclobacteriaceae bacterium]|nr:transporter [Cyclobacteriaceae bacterium]
MRRLYITLFFFGSVSWLQAQTLTDGWMMKPKTFCTGFMFGHDQWKNYWEGSLRRSNDNIGKLTTQSVMYAGTLGVTEKLNIIAMLPYIWTNASQGTLHGQQGIQDLTLGAKYRVAHWELGAGSLKAFGVLALSTPLTNYTPDFLPLSIGLQTKRVSWRGTLNYQLGNGWQVNATGAYTWRSNATLDRPSYYTDGQSITSSEVWMPNVIDYAVTVAYVKGSMQSYLSYLQQNTLGGGDIRRQDMPFVSNRMNYSKVEVLVMNYLPWPKGLAVRASAAYTVAGRNVGQSYTLMGGLMYTIQFKSNTDNTTEHIYE